MIIILVLLIGGTIYLRTVTNAENLDNRNLRELVRIGQGVEGRINNLHRVLTNYTSNISDSSDYSENKDVVLSPYLSAKIGKYSSNNQNVKNFTSEKIAFKTSLATSSLDLWHSFIIDTTYTDSLTLQATYDFESLRPTLSSEHMETIFLANDKGAIFMWETDRTNIRIHELAALDSLQFKENQNAGGIGKSDIIQTTVAGQDYRLYLLPLRVHFSEIDDSNNASDSEFTNWIIGGLTPQSDYRQQSLSLDPNMALFLGFLVIAGFLIVPFVRIFTMGPKERLKVGNLFYLVVALIFGSGLSGLWLADVVHFSPLKESVKNQLQNTANKVALNIDLELKQAIREIELKTAELNREIDEAGLTIDGIDLGSDKDTHILMKRDIPFDTSGTYPFYQMIFWVDSGGEQKAKWTPRAKNTPRIDVSQREYFKAIKENRGWDRKFLTNSDSSTCGNQEVLNSDKESYYIESIRSWNTGENVAAISIPWEYKDSSKSSKKGIAAITANLASLTTPVLPVGVGFAVVNSDAQTLFHNRPERILDENFAEETSNGDLLRSIIAARSCRLLEMGYEGKNKLMSIQPLTGRPLFLILYKDLPLIDTVRFEAWFEGGTLFGIWVLIILILIFFLERLPSSRMDWMWPDLKNPGKYIIFTIYSLVFIILLFSKAITEEHLHIHKATLVIPILYLGLGLVIMYHGFSSVSNGNKSILGWALSAVSIVLLGWLTILGGWETTRNEILATGISLFILWVWLRSSQLQDYINRWSSDLSPRAVYVTAMTTGLLVLGLLPGYIAYRFTFHDHSEHLVKYHQLELAESLQTRIKNLNEMLQDTWEINDWTHLSDSTWESSDYAYDLAYDSLIFKTQLLAPIETEDDENDSDSDLHTSIHGLLGNHIPFLTDASIKMRQLSYDQADRSWISDHKNHKLQLTGSNPNLLTSKIPAPGSWLNPWRITFLLTLTGILCLIVFRVSRWVFFVHLEHSDPLSLEDVLPKPGDNWRSTILIGTRSISRQPIFNRSPGIQYIDLIHDSDHPGDICDLLKNSPDDTKIQCLDHFDHRIDEEDRNHALLELLEKHMTQKDALPILILTSRDLDESLLTSNVSPKNKEELKHRWDRVLGRFSKLILSDYVSENSFKTLLQLRTIQKITGDINHLLEKLNRNLKNSSPSNPINLRYFKEFLAELTLKTDWLSYELKYQYNKSDTLSNEQEFIFDDIKNKCEKTEDKIMTLVKTIEEEETISKSHEKELQKLIKSAENFNELTLSIDKGKQFEKKEAYSELEKTLSSPLQFFKNMSIWFLIDPAAEAERLVYRDRKRIRNVCKTLLEECGQHERLQEIGEQLLYRPDWHTLKKDEIIDLIREGAEAHYRARWAILSDEEKLVAAQLSRGAVVNPKSQQPISRLFARGLIRRSPELRLDNASFAGFVKSTVSEDQLHRWEHAGLPSTWEMIRAPLVIALIVVSLFLFWSQREFLGNTITFLGTIGVGAGAIFNLLSKLGNVTGSPNLNNAEN